MRVPADSSRRVVLNITGSPQSTGSRDWEAFKGEWRGAFRRQADLATVAFEAQEGNPRPTGAAGTLLTVNVHDFRYLSPGARYGFGIMTGNAYIESSASFADLSTGTNFGTRSYSTTSSAWQGVFSAMTEKQVEALAAEMIREIRSASGPVSASSPAATPKASVTSAAPVGKTGDRSHDIERMGAVRECHPAPRAMIIAKGPGFENYSVTCLNGDALTLRCEAAGCRVLR